MTHAADLRRIHSRMCELTEAFYAIPISERTSGLRDGPIRKESAALVDEADALLPPPKLPQGFRWGYPEPLDEGNAVFGFRVLPDGNTPPELWGTIITFDDAKAILAPHGLEIRPVMGDFILTRIGKRHVQYVARRVRLIGPADGFKQVAHLFTYSERKEG